MPLLRLARRERPSLIVTAPSTPPSLREAAKALGARLAGSEPRELDDRRERPRTSATPTASPRWRWSWLGA